MDNNLPENQFVNQPVDPQSNPTVSITPVKKSNSFLTFLLGIFVTLMLVGGGYLIFKDKLNPVQPIPSPIPATSVIPTPDSTAGWETYSNKLFIIKLPLGWNKSDIDNPIQFLNYEPRPEDGRSFDQNLDSGKLKIEIYQNNTSDSLESYLTQQKSNAIELRGVEINWQETKTMIAGKEAVRVKTTNAGFVYYFKDISSNIIFSIAFGLDFDNYQELSNQILSTFKFNNQADKTANWKTYTNTSYKYSISYPSDWKTQVMAAGAGSQEAIPNANSIEIYKNLTSDNSYDGFIDIQPFGLKPDEYSEEKVLIPGTDIMAFTIKYEQSIRYLIEKQDSQGYLEIMVKNGSTAEINNILNKIFLTFKFTN